MVGSEPCPHAFITKSFILLQNCIEGGNGQLVLVKLPCFMHPCPSISSIKYAHIFGMFKRIKFAEPEKFFCVLKLSSCFHPKIKFNPKCKISPETVNIAFCYPEFHCLDHCLSHFPVFKIKFNDIIHT